MSSATSTVSITTSAALGDAPSEQRGWIALEVVWLLMIFFLFAGSPPPDVGEAHYLAKAKHYWEPSWASGDLFLESADAHQTFYWAFGWVTQFASLDASAWIGRLVTWLLLAWAWRRLSWSLVPVKLASLLTAGLMLLFTRGFHMAGEWIVGGVEAKGFAFALLFLALEALVRERWRAATLLAGAATAFHVLIGGWSLVCLAVVWLASPQRRLPLAKLWPALAGAVLLALPGLLPAVLLTRGADPAVVSEANQIYVFERLPHHLVFHRFEHFYMARHAVLLVAWGALAWHFRAHNTLRRLNLFVAAAVGLALIGVVLDQTLLYQRALAASLLRYYWFRLNDSMVPVATALATVAWIVQLQPRRPRLASGLLIVALLAAGTNLANVCYRRSQQRLPGSFQQPRPMLELPQVESSRVESTISPTELFAYWVAANEWIAANTPSESRFLTPRRQQTFKWYAERPEVANWKDVPQDAEALVLWKRAMEELYPPGKGRHDLAGHSEEALLRLARKHQADYLLLDRQRAGRPLAWKRVYPEFDEDNPAYEVYRVPAAQ